MQNRIIIISMILLIVSLVIILLISYFNSAPGLPADCHIDSIVVYKSKRTMLVFANGSCLKTYKIALGKTPVGDKEFEGDNKTPEGVYSINAKNPNSSFHKNLGISYPDSMHIAAAQQQGRSAGGDIKIHGLRNGAGWIGSLHRLRDWTAGCIAVTDSEIDELFAAVEIGAKIEIKP